MFELILGTWEVCDCRQVIDCPNLTICAAGRVQTFERTFSLVTVRSPSSCICIWGPVDYSFPSSRNSSRLSRKRINTISYTLSAYFFFRFNQWSDLLSRRGPDHAEYKDEFKNGLLAPRALCLRSFPEFLANLKMGATLRGLDTSTKLVNFAVSVSIFVSLSRYSCRYFTSDCQRFQILGPPSLYAPGNGNYKMSIQVGKGVKTEEADHSSIIDHFVRESPFKFI